MAQQKPRRPSGVHPIEGVISIVLIIIMVVCIIAAKQKGEPLIHVGDSGVEQQADGK